MLSHTHTHTVTDVCAATVTHVHFLSLHDTFLKAVRSEGRFFGGIKKAPVLLSSSNHSVRLLPPSPPLLILHTLKLNPTIVLCLQSTRFSVEEPERLQVSDLRNYDDGWICCLHGRQIEKCVVWVKSRICFMFFNPVINVAFTFVGIYWRDNVYMCAYTEIHPSIHPSVTAKWSRALVPPHPPLQATTCQHIVLQQCLWATCNSQLHYKPSILYTDL